MYGGNVGDPGTLNVYIQYDGQVGQHKIWSRSGDQVSVNQIWCYGSCFAIMSQFAQNLVQP